MATILQDAAVGFGLLFFYSSVADVAATTTALVSETVDVVAVTTTIAVNGLSSFLFSSAAAEMAVLSANLF